MWLLWAAAAAWLLGHPNTAVRTQPPAPTCPTDRLPCLQWDKVENKTSVIVYGAGGIVALWLAATIVGALNHIPLVRALVSQLPSWRSACCGRGRCLCESPAVAPPAAVAQHASAGKACPDSPLLPPN